MHILYLQMGERIKILSFSVTFQDFLLWFLKMTCSKRRLVRMKRKRATRACVVMNVKHLWLAGEVKMGMCGCSQEYLCFWEKGCCLMAKCCWSSISRRREEPALILSP